MYQTPPDLAAYFKNNLLTIKGNKEPVHGYCDPIALQMLSSSYFMNITVHSFKLLNTFNLYLLGTFLGLSYWRTFHIESALWHKPIFVAPKLSKILIRNYSFYNSNQIIRVVNGFHISVEFNNKHFQYQVTYVIVYIIHLIKTKQQEDSYDISVDKDC